MNVYSCGGCGALLGGPDVGRCWKCGRPLHPARRDSTLAGCVAAVVSLGALLACCSGIAYWVKGTPEGAAERFLASAVAGDEAAVEKAFSHYGRANYQTFPDSHRHKVEQLTGYQSVRWTEVSYGEHTCKLTGLATLQGGKEFPVVFLMVDNQDESGWFVEHFSLD